MPKQGISRTCDRKNKSVQNYGRKVQKQKKETCPENAIDMRYLQFRVKKMNYARGLFFDLAQTSTLTRAFVFIGVGIIMLVMNSIYNKYKGRFGSE
jgi:hypothetical protein